MTLNKPSGNMYPWAYTWNPLSGRCHHACSYCYVGRLRQKGLKKYLNDEPSFDEKAFKDDLTVPSDFVVFVQSCGDLFGYWIPESMIWRVLGYVKKFPSTNFLFQTKNPERFFDFNFPQNCILGTTIETNRDYGLTKAPVPMNRAYVMMQLKFDDYPLMLSLEPIMDFDLDIFTSWIQDIQPLFVSIGADSGKNKLEEPSGWKIQELIDKLKQQGIEVRLKNNLRRLTE